MHAALHLANARLADDGPLQHLRIVDGRIDAVGPDLTAGPADTIRDLGGRVVLPGLVELHAHLDKAYGDTRNQSGGLGEAIMTWMRARPGLSAADFRARAERGIRAAIAHGVTALRTHVDVMPGGDLTAVRALLEVREALGDCIDLQLVALGHQVADAAMGETVREALALGVDVIGGVPALCRDPKAEIEAILDLAQATGRPVDLHIDETERPRTLTLELLADAILARGGVDVPVTAGHCVALAFAERDRAKAVMARVAEAAIAVVALPITNQVLLGRRAPAPRAIAPVKALMAAGVTVCAASDNVQDMFNPFGDHDPLRAAQLTALIGHLSGAAELDDALQMVTGRAAAVFHGAPRRVEAGQPADLVVIDARSRREAIATVPPRLLTLKRGRVVFEAQIERTWHLSKEGR